MAGSGVACLNLMLFFPEDFFCLCLRGLLFFSLCFPIQNSLRAGKEYISFFGKYNLTKEADMHFTPLIKRTAGPGGSLSPPGLILSHLWSVCMIVQSDLQRLARSLHRIS